MKIKRTVLLAGMAAGFVLMAVISYLVTDRLTAPVNTPAAETLTPAADNGLLPCPGNCAGCTLCSATLVIQEEPGAEPAAVTAVD